MRTALADFSPATLVRANRANLYEFFRYFKNSPSMEFTNSDGLSRWSCRFQFAWFNGILCARDAKPADGAYLDDSLAYFRARDTNEISCWLEDGVNLAGWEPLLARRGFHFEEGPGGMSVDLHRLNETVPIPDGVEIATVNDEKGVRDCAQVQVHGYGFPPDSEEIAIDFVAGLGLDTPYRGYVAYSEGKPVSTAGVFFGEEVAGIYSVTTLKEERGKGIGAAVTLAPLLEARTMGYRVAILQSSKLGLPVYQRLGFQLDSRVGWFSCTL